MERVGTLSCACDTPPAADDWLRIGLGLVISGQLMVLGLAFNLSTVDAATHQRLSIAFLVLTALGVGLLGPDLWRNVKQRFAQGQASLEAMFLLAMAGGLGASLWGLFMGGDVFFEVVTTVLTVHALGAKLESTMRATALAKAGDRFFASGLVQRCEGETVVEVDANVLAVDDIVLVAPGARIPADGVVVHGSAWLDTSSIDGERLTRAVQEGSPVMGGTYVRWGSVRVRVLAPPADSAHRRALDEFQAAWNEGSSAQGLARKLTRFFTPTVATIAVVSGAWWTCHTGAGMGFRAMTAVLLVACPCGLGIATPMAMWSAASSLDGRGVVVRRLRALESLGNLKHVVLDKTGTLMDLAPHVAWQVEAGVDASRLRRWVGAVESQSAHPVASVLQAPDAQVQIVSLDEVPGGGLSAVISEDGVKASIQIKPSGDSARRLEVWLDGARAAVLTLEERLAEGAQALVSGLRARGLGVEILTGDRVSAPFDVPVQTGVRPAEKAQHVRALGKSGEVAFVGDAANDLPAFAASGVAVAVRSALPAVSEQADIAVDHPSALLIAIDEARALKARVRGLLILSVTGNIIGISFAAAGHLHPVLAAVIMAGSSFLVTLAAISEGRRVG